MNCLTSKGFRRGLAVLASSCNGSGMARQHGELSLLTFMIYRNDGYEGGATRFESSLVAGKLGPMGQVFG